MNRLNILAIEFVDTLLTILFRFFAVMTLWRTSKLVFQLFGADKQFMHFVLLTLLMYLVYLSVKGFSIYKAYRSSNSVLPVWDVFSLVTSFVLPIAYFGLVKMEQHAGILSVTLLLLSLSFYAGQKFVKELLAEYLEKNVIDGYCDDGNVIINTDYLHIWSLVSITKIKNQHVLIRLVDELTGYLVDVPFDNYDHIDLSTIITDKEQTQRRIAPRYKYRHQQPKQPKRRI